MTPKSQVPAVGFEEAYREHRLDLLRLAYLMCGSYDVSEDVVQSAFTTAHGRWDQIEHPLPYLKRAVVNLVKDGQRRRFRRMGRPADPPAVVHYYEDLPLTEVADALGRPASTVRSDHRRALDKLRKALA